MSTGWLLIDYQNLHFSAGDVFEPHGTPPEDYLVHPDRFAAQVEVEWQNKFAQPLEIRRVDVFRGLPDPRKEGALNGHVSRQNRLWTSGRVNVYTRALRYPRDWPNSRAEEKGIDVLLALSFFRAVLVKKSDYVARHGPRACA
ncbi:hypothetical protein [Arenivirga flava]|uniref:NYN domain-containing protein n=1 Tax=Arenivirga flava TaxID=1930060 RepID=A0AA37UTI0_9MICO|nr:hypothetical protein [Arenivirga flava]GMA29961.1 hypothetical protein GCM10025874_32140 [Arenivirga flava]